MARPTFSAFAAALVPVLAGAILASLWACDGAPVTSAIRRIEDPWAVAQGASVLPVIVVGLPARSSLPGDSFAEAVVTAAGEAMTWTAHSPLALASRQSASGGLRLVYAFDGSGDQCRLDRPGDGAGSTTGAGGNTTADGRITLVAVLCDGTEWLARVDGRIAGAKVDERRILRLVGQATRDLLAPPPAPRP